MELLTLLLIIIVGIFIGIVSVTVGSSSLITIPFLMALGLSPYTAIATNKLSAISSFVTGGITYHQKGMMRYKRLALLLSVAALAGSSIGAHLVFTVNEQILKIITIVLLIAVLVITIMKDKLGIKHHRIEFTRQNYVLSFVTIFFLGIYAGFFGAGFGTFTIFSLIFFFGLTLLESAALMTVINFFALVVAVIVFAMNNAIHYSIGIPLMVSVGAGGWIGAHAAIVKGNVLIKRLFIVITVILILKLIINF